MTSVLICAVGLASGVDPSSQQLRLRAARIKPLGEDALTDLRQFAESSPHLSPRLGEDARQFLVRKDFSFLQLEFRQLILLLAARSLEGFFKVAQEPSAL